MLVPFIDLKSQHRLIRREVLQTLSHIADTQKFILGEYGLKLEKAVAEYTGVDHAVALASGSDAIYLSLLALNVGAHDEVITTPFTFFASAGSITRTGAKVVFCDIDPETCNIDVRQIPSKINSRTKAILPVHLFGAPCNMVDLLKTAKSHGLFVVEDAAQSFGATVGGKRTGSMGQAGCFSFYPTKNLGAAGDAGMAVTSSKSLADKIRLMRNHGSERKYHHRLVGVNSRLDEVQAAWLLIKLKHIDTWNAQRNHHAALYEDAFKDLPIKKIRVLKGCVSNQHLYTIQTKNRDALSNHLTARGIGNGVYYPSPLHLESCYRNLKHRKGDFPVSERMSKEVLSLPMYAELGSKEINAVIRAVRSFFK